MIVDLTEDQIRVVLRALSVCAEDMQECAIVALNTDLQWFYEQKADEYEGVYDAVYRSAGFDRAACRDCPDPACSVCADMKK